jgi:TRAP-type C4-dicarboxylate transport system permease small subunit
MSFAEWRIKVEGFSKVLSIWFNWVGRGALLVMVGVTFVDIFAAKVINLPIVGSFEIVGLGQVVAIGGAIAYTQIAGRHVRVELLSKRLPRLPRAFLYSFTALLGLAAFVVLCWQCIRLTIELKTLREVSGTILIPHYPFALWLALCCVPMCFVLLSEVLNSLAEGVKK